MARSASGKPGHGQIVALLVGGLLAGANLRAEVDVGLVLGAACLLGVLSVLERRQFYGIVQKLQHRQDDGDARTLDSRTT